MNDRTFDFRFKRLNVRVEARCKYSPYPPYDAKCHLCDAPIDGKSGFVPFSKVNVTQIINTDSMYPIDLNSVEGRAIIAQVKELEKLAICHECDEAHPTWEEKFLPL